MARECPTKWKKGIGVRRLMTMKTEKVKQEGQDKNGRMQAGMT